MNSIAANLPKKWAEATWYKSTINNVTVNAPTVNIPAPTYTNNSSNNLATGKYNFGNVTLKNGSTGAAVMELQRFLNANLNLGLVIDGRLGPKTIAVIKKWQIDHNLVPDGLIGAKTKAIMNSGI